MAAGPITSWQIEGEKVEAVMDFFFFFFLGTKSHCRCDCNHEIKRHLLLAYSLEGLKLKLKLQYFGHLMQRTDSMEKTLMLGKIEGRKRRG